LQFFPRHATLLPVFALLGAAAMVLACQIGGPDNDAGTDLSCDALPGVCSYEGASSYYPFSPSSCPNLEPVTSMACPDATTVYAVCGVGGFYNEVGCKKTSCATGRCDAGRPDGPGDAAGDNSKS
jgi:hypothetical protein